MTLEEIFKTNTLDFLAQEGKSAKETEELVCASSEFWGSKIMTLAQTAEDKFNLHASGRRWKNHLDRKEKSPNCKSIVANVTHPNGVCWSPSAAPLFHIPNHRTYLSLVFSTRICSETPPGICPASVPNLDPLLLSPHHTLISQLPHFSLASPP